MEKQYYEWETDTLIAECVDYMNHEQDIDCLKSYLNDLNIILHQKTVLDKWTKLIESGLFHDAIGKVIQSGWFNAHMRIVVRTEY